MAVFAGSLESSPLPMSSAFRSVALCLAFGSPFVAAPFFGATTPITPGETAAAAATLAAPQSGLRLPEIRLHDPWVLADARTQTYYLYSSAAARMTPEKRTGTLYYRSKDLATWEGPFLAFVAPEGTWANASENAWAPEVHAYAGKYYLFTTLHNPQRTLPGHTTERPHVMRSTIIAVADAPTGPFTLLKTDAPTAPAEFMVLDGTLYVDPAGKPWMRLWTRKLPFSNHM